MIEIKPDPSNPERLILTATVTIFLERVLLESLGKELEAAIQEQAKHDLKSRAVQRQLCKLSTEYLAKVMGIAPEEKK